MYTHQKVHIPSDGSVSSRATIRMNPQGVGPVRVVTHQPLAPHYGDSPALWELGMGTHGLLGFSAVTTLRVKVYTGLLPAYYHPPYTTTHQTST